MEIDVLNHASTRIQNSKVIYIDPYEVNEEKADIILITHSHYDHCSIADIRKLSKPSTKIVIPPDCTSKLGKIEKANITIITPGKKLNIEGVVVEAVPAYNVEKRFHPKENQWLGYIVKIGNKRIYHAGDTDFIPEMKDISADVVLLPVGGTYTMNAEEAAKAANTIKPEIAIPMHFGSVVGSRDDAERFKELCSCKVRIPDIS